MNRKSIASWCLYDFANSIYVAVVPATIWAAYYANVIVGNDQGQGDLWWGRVVSSTMLFVAVTSPVLGAIADYAGKAAGPTPSIPTSGPAWGRRRTRRRAGSFAGSTR